MGGSRLLAGLTSLVLLVPSLAGADQPGAFRGEVSAIGMGNTGVAVAGRGCLWHYNPALLNTFSFDLAIPSINLGANGKAFELFDFLDDNQDNFAEYADLTIPEKLAFIDDASEFYGRPLGFRTAPLVGLATRNFGAALFADTRGTIVMRRPASLLPPPKVPANPPAVWGYFTTDVVVQLGTAGLADPLAVGVNVRYVNRAGKAVSIDPADLDELIKTLSEDPERFHGWAVDVGVYYPTGFWNLDVGASFRNLLGEIQVFDLETTDDLKDKKFESFHRNLAEGAAWHPIPRLLLTADVEDIFNDVYGLEFGDQIHLGAELDMLFLMLRTGVFRGQVTYGIGVNLGIVKIDFATFIPAEDRPGLTEEEERVYIGQAKIGW